MLYRRGLAALTLVWVVGCAQGGHDVVHLDDATQRGGGDDDDGTVDAPERRVDAPDGCDPTTQDLLRNGNFDAAPTGTMWTQNPVKQQFPIITKTTGSATPQSGDTLAWLGGVVQADANDSLYQEVTVPAGTTSLVLTGYYWVLTAETGAFAFDLSTVELVKPDGTQIETVMNLDNTSAGTTWTAINFTANEDLSGQAIRLKFSSSSDDSNVTDFYFDSLALTATTCR